MLKLIDLKPGDVIIRDETQLIRQRQKDLTIGTSYDVLSDGMGESGFDLYIIEKGDKVYLWPYVENINDTVLSGIVLKE